MDIIVASNNKGKLGEIKQIFSAHNIISMAEAGYNLDIDETGSTFLENALIKAKTIFEATHRPTLSDDSGLSVNALNGQPGIHSARYSQLYAKTSSDKNPPASNDAIEKNTASNDAIEKTAASSDCEGSLSTVNDDKKTQPKTQDELNNELLLHNLAGISDRRAKFVSVVVLYFGEGKYIHAIGEVEGEILLSPRGSEGFGYDPLFYSTELKKTFSEASMSEKNTISHRARALANLAKKMTNLSKQL